MLISKSQTQRVIDWLLASFAGGVQQGDVQGAFGRHVMRRNSIEIGHGALDVIERQATRIHFLEEGFDAGYRFLVTGRRRSFAKADSAIGPGEFHDDAAESVCAAASRDG